MANFYQVSADKFAIEWPIITVRFADGGQITARGNEHLETLIGDRRVIQRESSIATKTGSFEDCQRQQ